MSFSKHVREREREREGERERDTGPFVRDHVESSGANDRAQATVFLFILGPFSAGASL